MYTICTQSIYYLYTLFVHDLHTTHILSNTTSILPYITHTLPTRPTSHPPEDILLVLRLPGSLEGGVLGPHGEGDPGVVEDVLAEQRPPGALGLDVGLRQGPVAGSVALQAVEVCGRDKSILTKVLTPVSAPVVCY